VVRLVVDRLLQQGQNTGFKLSHEVSQHLAVGTTHVDSVLSFELAVKRLFVNSVLLPAVVISVVLSENLPEHSLLSCVVDFARLFESQCLVTIDMNT